MTLIATPAPLYGTRLSLANCPRPSYTHEPPPDGRQCRYLDHQPRPPPPRRACRLPLQPDKDLPLPQHAWIRRPLPLWGLSLFGLFRRSGPGRSRRHSSSSPIPPTMPPSAHMQAWAHLWTKMPPEIQNQLAKMFVSDLRAGLNHAKSTATRDAEATATRHASELAEEEYQQAHQHLLAAEKDTAPSLPAARAAYDARQVDTQDCAIVVGFRVKAHERAKAAVFHSSRNHEFQLADLNNQPRQPPPPTTAHPTILPASPARHRRPPPLGPSAVPSPTLGPRSPPATTTLPNPPLLITHTLMSGCPRSNTATRNSPAPSEIKSMTCPRRCSQLSGQSDRLRPPSVSRGIWRLPSAHYSARTPLTTC